MRRADRFFQILQILRRGSSVTAARMAGELQVSRRTIYRDVHDMIASGVPVDGEAGVGFILRPGHHLPPLMFTEQEVESLILGARIVQSWADPQLGRAAEDVIAKVREVLPTAMRPHIDAFSMWAPANHAQEPIAIDQAAVRMAIRDQRKIRFSYRDLQEQGSERVLRPLVMAFFGPV
jgi:predicted DNA-binding transcriptional regulator YafY